MKIHIPEQSFELEEGGMGRIRFEVITEANMEHDPLPAPEADSAPAEAVAAPEVAVAAAEVAAQPDVAPQVEVAADAGVQAPAPEEAKEEVVA